MNTRMNPQRHGDVRAPRLARLPRGVGSGGARASRCTSSASAAAAAAVVLVAGMTLCLGGCSSTDKPAETTTPTAASSEAEAERKLREMFERLRDEQDGKRPDTAQASRRNEAVLPRNRPAAAPGTGDAASAPAGGADGPTPGLTANAPVSLDGSAAAGTNPGAAGGPPVKVRERPVPPSADAKTRDQLLTDLAKTIGASVRADSSDGAALRAALELTVLESLGASAAGVERRRLEGRLSTSESGQLAALREVLGRAPSTIGTDPAAFGALLVEQSKAFASVTGLRIPHAVLARRVEGFGRLTAIEPATFLVGRAHPVLVYTEADQFSRTPVDGDDATGPSTSSASIRGEQLWAIDLSQELELRASDGTLAWRSAEQPARDVSARKRVDHYLVQRVDLPANLSIGSYSLKVVLRDRANGSSAEAIIPLQIVADPRLTSR